MEKNKDKPDYRLDNVLSLDLIPKKLVVPDTQEIRDSPWAYILAMGYDGPAMGYGLPLGSERPIVLGKPVSPRHITKRPKEAETITIEFTAIVQEDQGVKNLAKRMLKRLEDKS